MYLLDINVLFAALSKTHKAHQIVNRWLQTIDEHASCGLTQIGTFRLLLTPAPMYGNPLDPADAHESIMDFTGRRHHKFVACPALSCSVVGRTNGHNAAVDDYLVQIANDAGCRLATLDRALATRWPERTFLIN